MTPRMVKKLMIWGAIGLVVLITILLSFYTVPEGHIGVIKRFGKAVDQVGPGMHFKVPYVDGVEQIEVRQRKNVEQLAAATANQLPIGATVSINWTVNTGSAMELFIKYGGLDQFETRILDPKLRSAAKAAISHFPADKLIRNRQEVVATIMELMLKELSEFPITINSPQLENIHLPESYADAVRQKEIAREGAEREKHALEKQRLVAQQEVNTAIANAEARRIHADAKAYQVITIATSEANAEAYKVTTVAEAEAQAITQVSEALEGSPLYIELTKAKRWDGMVPKTILGGDSGVLLSLPSQ